MGSYGHFGVYGKRDADAEAEPYLYATGGGLSTYRHPVVSTVAAAVPAVAAVTAVNTVVPTVHSAVNTVAHAAVPAVAAVNTYAGVPAVHTTVGGYTQVAGHGVYGKREAEAEPYFYNGVYGGIGHYGGVYGYPYSGVHYGVYGKREAEAEPYTIGQVYAGLPVHNAYATGHPHNVGFTNYISHGYGGFGVYGKR